MVRWGFWGLVVGFLALATLLPSWRPGDRLFFAALVLGVPTLLAGALGWLWRRLRR